MIVIESNTALATVQDLGRFGHYRDGVGRSGAMDTVALMVGNALLGNAPGAAAIEIPLFPLKVRFDADLDVAVTGADGGALLDGRPLPPDWCFKVRAGQSFSLSGVRRGCRAYLCVSGGIDVPPVLGSRSTQLREAFGGYAGRMLAKGDILTAGQTGSRIPEDGLGAIPAAEALPLLQDDKPAVRVVPAAEYERFDAASLASFWSSDWKVTAQSNRIGYRLAGPDLVMVDKRDLRSHGIVPGVIQVPVGGQPIVQLADGATMGGYPKIGTVIEADQWRLAQTPPGAAIRFVKTDHAGAISAQEELDRYIDMVRESALLQHGAAERWQ